VIVIRHLAEIHNFAFHLVEAGEPTFGLRVDVVAFRGDPGWPADDLAGDLNRVRRPGVSDQHLTGMLVAVSCPRGSTRMPCGALGDVFGLTDATSNVSA